MRASFLSSQVACVGARRSLDEPPVGTLVVWAGPGPRSSRCAQPSGAPEGPRRLCYGAARNSATVQRRVAIPAGKPELGNVVPPPGLERVS